MTDTLQLIIERAEHMEGFEVRIEALEAELKEAYMQSLADLGQAQEAYEAQKKAEAERDKLKEVINQMRAIVENSDDT